MLILIFILTALSVFEGKDICGDHGGRRIFFPKHLPDCNHVDCASRGNFLKTEKSTSDVQCCKFCIFKLMMSVIIFKIFFLKQLSVVKLYNAHFGPSSPTLELLMMSLEVVRCITPSVASVTTSILFIRESVEQSFKTAAIEKLLSTI